jgi:hypothetical protein
MTQLWSRSNPYTADGKATMLRLGEKLFLVKRKEIEGGKKGNWQRMLNLVMFSSYATKQNTGTVDYTFQP